MSGSVTPVRLESMRQRSQPPTPRNNNSSPSSPIRSPISTHIHAAVAEKGREPSLRHALVLLDQFSMGEFFKELFALYKLSLKQYPVYTKSITSATIAVLGEIVASIVKHKLSQRNRAGSPTNGDTAIISARRLGVFGLYGLLCTGPMLHYWYSLLEYILTIKMGLSGGRKIAAKLLIDRCLWGPPFVLFTISFLQLLQTLSPKATAEAIKKSYVAILLMNQKVWVPGQLLNFAVIPVEFQVLFVNAVNVGWNTYLSMAQ